jgi:P4 family phage/plasmid primase-like protien
LSGLPADRDELARFVGALFRHADEGGFVSLRTFEHEPGVPPVEVRAVAVNGEGLGPVIAQAAGAATRAARHPRPAVFAPPVCTFVSDRRAAETDVRNGVALSFECDERPEEVRRRLEDILGPATAVVASGGLWMDPTTGALQEKLHLHWRLAEPTRDAADHARLKRARRLSVALAGGDPSAVPLVHPLRWPGSWHRKGEPKLCRIIVLREEVEIDLADVLERLEQAASLALEHATGDQAQRLRLALQLRDSHRATPELEIDPDARDADLEALADAIPNADELWNEYVAIGLAFYAASDGSAAGFNAFARWAQKSSSKYKVTTTARDWDHFGRSPPTRTDKGALVQRARRVDPAFRLPSWGPGGRPVRTEPLDISHDGLALEMGEAWPDARHVAPWGRWLFWSGQGWEQDERLLHLTKARSFLRQKAGELTQLAKATGNPAAVAAAEAHGKTLRSAPMVANVIGLARSNLAQAATVEQWDADPWLLGTPGGTVDLHTGELRPGRLEDYITKQTLVGPAPVGTPAPLWGAFLERIFRHDPNLVPYLQRVAGYALTGLATEHVLFFAWGQGGNGKGVFLNTLAHVLAGYAAVAPPDLLLITAGDRHPTDMAMLRGARFVTASEVAPGRAWDEPKLKSLTGGDPITARFMRQDFFTYAPQFTLFVAGNHKPSFRSVDEAVRRRVQLVPFLQNIPKEERDPELGTKLKAEAPAILRWMIDGCLAWQREGLSPPASVREASESYLEGEDALGQWLDERCELDAAELTPFNALFRDWQAWGQANGGPDWGGKGFSKALDERGFERGKSGSVRGFRGIRLRPRAEPAGKQRAWEADL